MATPRKSLEEYLALQYPMQVIAAPEGGYVIIFPDLPGCMTQVETADEIGPMAEDARRGWMESVYEHGPEIPLPTYPGEHSGRFNVRIPRSLHRQLAEGADQEGVSLNQYVTMLLSQCDAIRRVERWLDGIEAPFGEISRDPSTSIVSARGHGDSLPSRKSRTRLHRPQGQKRNVSSGGA
jgi:antitoxin HicB